MTQLMNQSSVHLLASASRGMSLSHGKLQLMANLIVRTLYTSYPCLYVQLYC